VYVFEPALEVLEVLDLLRVSIKMKIHTITCIGDIGDFHNGFGDADTEETKGHETTLWGQKRTGIFTVNYYVLILLSCQLMNISDVKWVIMSKVDEAKAHAQDICISKRGI
jgi:hypothetical protein